MTPLQKKQVSKIAMILQADNSFMTSKITFTGLNYSAAEFILDDIQASFIKLSEFTKQFSKYANDTNIVFDGFNSRIKLTFYLKLR